MVKAVLTGIRGVAESKRLIVWSKMQSLHENGTAAYPAAGKAAPGAALSAISEGCLHVQENCDRRAGGDNAHHVG